jgi:hypothetical protein
MSIANLWIVKGFFFFFFFLVYLVKEKNLIVYVCVCDT